MCDISGASQAADHADVCTAFSDSAWSGGNNFCMGLSGQHAVLAAAEVLFNPNVCSNLDLS